MIDKERLQALWDEYLDAKWAFKKAGSNPVYRDIAQEEMRRAKRRHHVLAASLRRDHRTSKHAE